MTCCVIFGAFQFVLCFSIIRILFLRGYEATDSQHMLSGKKLSTQILAYSYTIIYRACLQPITAYTIYLLLLFVRNANFASYKKIDDWPVISPFSWQHILLFVFLIFCFIEAIIFYLSNIFFCNDFSILRISFWSTNSWQSPLVELITKIYISAIFVIDSQVSCPIILIGFIGRNNMLSILPRIWLLNYSEIMEDRQFSFICRFIRVFL